MKIYEIWYSDDGEGNCLSWAGTQAKAAAQKKALRADGYPETAIKVTPIDFPTKKAELIGWLNSRFTRDNG